MLVGIILLLVLTCQAQVDPNPGKPTLVRVEDGFLSGFEFKGYRQFLKVPYAAPPIGDLRWQPPTFPEPWRGIRDATQSYDGCPQPDFLPNVEEDCLYLNIWAPPSHVAPPPEGFPVQAFIHNGAYDTSSPLFGRDGLFTGEQLIPFRQNIILVSTSHRLGALGYMCSHEVKKHTPDGSAGNFGTQDTRFAYEWVRRNIHQFGGNPNRIMIYGTSGGGMHVANHMTNNRSIDVFDAGMMQSGSAGTRTGNTLTRGTVQYLEMAEFFGCRGSTDKVYQCLLQVSAKQLVEYEFHVTGEFEPCQDNVEFALPTADLAALGRAHNKPVIIGMNLDEGNFQCTCLKPPMVNTPKKYDTYLRLRFGLLAKEIQEFYPYDQFLNGWRAARRIATDLYVTCGARRTLRWLAQSGPTYGYVYGLNTLTSRGVDHGSEIPSFFNKENCFEPGKQCMANNTSLFRYLEVSHEIVDRMAHYSATGNPNYPGAPIRWPQFTLDNDVVLLWGERGDVLVHEYRKRECEFWDKHLEFDGWSWCVDTCDNPETSICPCVLDDFERKEY